jgi:archaellum component FlaC
LEQITADQRNLSEKSARMDELENAIAQAHETIKNLIAQSQDERDAVKALEERLRQAQEHAEKLTRQLQEERAALESLRTQHADLHASKERDVNAAQAALKREMEE